MTPSPAPCITSGPAAGVTPPGPRISGSVASAAGVGVEEQDPAPGRIRIGLVAALEHGGGDAARVGGEPEPPRHVRDGSEPSRLGLVVAIGQRPVGVREDDDADHERVDLDQLLGAVVGEHPAPPPDPGEAGARRQRGSVQSAGARADGSTVSSTATKPSTMSGTGWVRRGAERPRISVHKPDTGESLHQRRDRRADPRGMTQPNRDLEHHGRNNHDLDLDEHQPSAAVRNRPAASR